MREHDSRLRRFAVCTAAAVAVAAGSCVAGTGAVEAAPVSAFYTPPAQLPAQSGAVVKSEPMPIYATLPGGGGQWPVAAQRVMYTSRTQDSAPVAVSGTYIEPTRAWEGNGPRPTVVIAPGTVGQGTQCAPSIAFSTGFVVSTDPLSMSPNQEVIAAAAWSSMGARVLVTDYIGLGTPGLHTYVNRAEEAHAALDGARAANRLGGVSESTPLVLWGYSQGGGATAAAAELQPSYAPELNLKGTWAGAPPADLAKVLAQVDGTLISGVIGFAINGFLARNPQLQGALDAAATPQGKAMLHTLSTECIGDVIVKQPFMHTSDLTVDHRSMLEHLNTIPGAVEVLNEQRIGTLRPSSPVLITSGRNDDTVPYGQARQLATDWCAQGATVTFRTNNLPPILPGATLPNHFGPELIDGYGTNNAISYLVDRLNGKPISGCTIN
ncbi:lipase family protein [Nocardia macrotermitis]|uniref:Putative inactive lipase n=1 Tax=Nocardia macrotermitis TaxID=2585198 RepID=A0A7K0CZ97_9NOCA|nr:lipase family protein [Nocardia macrotermitis]MQY18803.1 putative inactive lipase [Nocardia macrotermitis]